MIVHDLTASSRDRRAPSALLPGLLLLPALFVFPGISSCEPTPEGCVGDGTVQYVLTEADAGMPLYLCTRDRVEFTYNWAPNAAYTFSADIDERYLRLVTVYADPTPPGCSDCPSLQHWVFEGTDPGDTTLTMVKSWYTGQPDQAFSFPVLVGQEEPLPQ